MPDRRRLAGRLSGERLLSMARRKPARIGIFGGSFNPPHICHVFACAFALATEEVDEVWVVPCYRHPFGKDLAAFGHRVRMLRLAMRPLGARVRVSVIEKTLADPSYTYHTVRTLRRVHPERSFRLVLGSDILRESRRWYRFADVIRMAPPLLVPRLTTGRTASTDRFALPAVSSTDVRRRLGRGGHPGPVLPAAVYRYVQENGLYVPGRRAAGTAPR